jgi:hypothetical protein
MKTLKTLTSALACISLGLVLILSLNSCEKDEQCTISSSGDTWVTLFDGDSEHDYYFDGYNWTYSSYNFSPDSGVIVTLKKNNQYCGGILRLTNIFNFTEYLNSRFNFTVRNLYQKYPADVLHIEFECQNKQTSFNNLEYFNLLQGASNSINSDIDFLCGWADSISFDIRISFPSDTSSYGDSVVVNFSNITVTAKE